MEVLNSLLPDTEITRCDDVIASEEKSLINVMLSAIQQEVGCPICGQMSSRIHSRYQRRVADLPWAGIPVRLSLHVRRFFCENCHCQRQIFTERLPTVVAPWARRTQRLAQSQQQIALAVGGSGAAKLSEKLSMPAGIDLSLTLIRQVTVSEPETLRVVGVDDWAKRKGQAYGTIVVDLERGTIVDLLPDRTPETVSEWLQKHPGIEIINRDRAGAYAEAAREGAPEATQVADRWHLLKNMNDTLFSTLQQYQADIEKLLTENNATSCVPPESEAKASNPTVEPATLCQPPTPADIRRQQNSAEARRLHQLGWTAKDIAQQLNLHVKTIRRYLRLPLPAAPQRRNRRSKLEPYKSYIIRRWNEGCRNAMQLLREIEAQGFTGKQTSVRDFVKQLRLASGVPLRVRKGEGKPIKAETTKRPPTLRSLAWYVLKRPELLGEEEKQRLTKIRLGHSEVEKAIQIAQDFAAMIRQQKQGYLDEWLNQAIDSGLKDMRNFALTLRQDYAAVKAALSLHWSNGPTEGHVNRLKCLKRQMVRHVTRNSITLAESQN